MSIGAIFLLAVSLAMDAVAVAATRGLLVSRIRARDVGLVMLFFGGAQGAMPLLGYWLGAQLGPSVVAWDHWIAFVLLAGIGAKMLYEAFQGDDEEEDKPEGNPLGLRVMTVLAIATSIDAFAVGITLPLLEAPLLPSILAIGVVTALLSALGFVLARRFAALLGKKLEIFGGVVLIALGAKILIEHWMSSM